MQAKEIEVITNMEAEARAVQEALKYSVIKELQEKLQKGKYKNSGNTMGYLRNNKRHSKGNKQTKRNK